MQGEELSHFAICAGESFVSLLPAQDHKAIGEGDTGPNTGGMGAYAPVSIASEQLVRRIEDEIVRPTLRALAEEGRPFNGVLYTGLMLTSAGPKVVEFNCRFGDPEAEVLLPLLDSSLLELVVAAVAGDMGSVDSPRWRSGAAVTTIMASGGYPGSYRTGLPIDVPERLGRQEDVIVFHAGTAVREGRVVTAGGRVLSVTALGSDVGVAAERSRAAAADIEFDGRYFRRDIGWREIARV